MLSGTGGSSAHTDPHISYPRPEELSGQQLQRLGATRVASGGCVVGLMEQVEAKFDQGGDVEAASVPEAAVAMAGAGAVFGTEAGSVVAIRLTRLHWYDRGCLQVPFLFCLREFLLGGRRIGRFGLHCSNGFEDLPIRLRSYLGRLGHFSGCKLRSGTVKL